MSLFKLVMVAAAGIAIMPSDREQQARLYQQAASAAHWTLTFCDRNARTCENASVAWAAFVSKAEFAGQLAYDVATRSAAETPQGVQATAASADGTLAPADLRPAWRGTHSRQGI